MTDKELGDAIAAGLRAIAQLMRRRRDNSSGIDELRIEVQAARDYDGGNTDEALDRLDANVRVRTGRGAVLTFDGSLHCMEFDAPDIARALGCLL